MTTREQRLGAALLIFGLVDEPPADALAALATCPLLTPSEIEAWRDTDERDMSLANACLAVERELRDAQWTALAVLDLALHGPEAQAERRGSCADSAGGNAACVQVPRADLARMASFVLGW